MADRSNGIVLLGTLLALCSSGPFYVAPDFLEAMHRDHGMSLTQVGYVSGAESLAITIGCVAAGLGIRHIGWRAMLAAGLAGILLNLLTMAVTDYPGVLAVRTLTGLLSEGPLYAMSYAVLGSSANPDRAFSIGIGGVAGGASLFLSVSLWSGAPFGPATVFIPYAGIALLLVLLVVRTRPVIHSQPLAAMAPPDASMRAGLILAALVLWSAAAAAFWAFTGTASSTLGVPAQTVSQALAIAMVAGLAGMLVPMVIGSRFGRVMPLVLASIGLSLSCALFFAGSGLVQLAVALTLQQFCWNISSVYLLAGLAMLDASGRYSALGAVAQIGGMAVGPAVSGLFLARFGYGGLPAAVTAVSLIASAIFFVSLRGSGQGKPAEAPGHA